MHMISMGSEIQNDVKLVFKSVVEMDRVDWKMMDYVRTDFGYKDYIKKANENTKRTFKKVNCYPDALGLYSVVVDVPYEAEIVEIGNRCFPFIHNVQYEVVMYYRNGSRVSCDIQARRSENHFMIKLRHVDNAIPVKLKYSFLGELPREYSEESRCVEVLNFGDERRRSKKGLGCKGKKDVSEGDGDEGGTSC